jgi:alkylation response protein AidB-like acyl-CoA dehydrogenase
VLPRTEEFLEARAFPRDLWVEAGKQGYLGLAIPEAYGGSAARDYRYNAVLAEELSKVGAALSSCIGIHADVVAPYLVELTSQQQKRRWLPPFCTGELVTAIAMTEPSGGSDLAALRTTAVRDGDGWVLNGSKTFITNGYSADLVVVAARTSPEKKAKGITLFGVETGMPGFTRGRKLDKVGQTESDTAELFFDDVRVPAGNVIGEVDRGFIAMMERLPQERLGAAVSNLAHARQILDETLDYVRERTAFGQSVGSFQHHKFLLAELVTQVEVAQAYVDDAVLAHTDRELTAVDAAKAKWWSAQVQNDVLDACVQLHGGYGYMNEYRVARAWRDARVTKIWAGSNEIMKELIGRDLGL